MNKYCVECTGSTDCTRCFGCIGCESLTDCDGCVASVRSQELAICHFCEDCVNCWDSSYLKGCANCLGCTGLKNKTKGYWVRNREVTEREFEDALREYLPAKGIVARILRFLRRT